MATIPLHFSSYYMPKVYPQEINVVGWGRRQSGLVTHCIPMIPGSSSIFLYCSYQLYTASFACSIPVILARKISPVYVGFPFLWTSCSLLVYPHAQSGYYITISHSHSWKIALVKGYPYSITIRPYPTNCSTNPYHPLFVWFRFTSDPTFLLRRRRSPRLSEHENFLILGRELPHLETLARQTQNRRGSLDQTTRKVGLV